jgi:hypothetical protein
MALSQQEIDEELKLANGLILITSAMKKMAQTLKTQPTPFSDEFRSRFSGAYQDLAEGFNHVAVAMGRVALVSGNMADQLILAPYPKNLEIAKSNLELGIGRIKNATGQLGTPSLSAFGSSLADVQAAMAQIHSFDITLPYADPLPVNFPAIVGPHGDYVAANSAGFRGLEYFSEGLAAIFLSFHPTRVPSWPADATEPYALMLEASADMFNRWTRATVLTIGFGVPDDEAIVANDTAHGSGLRPASFFRTLLAHEYFMSAGGVGLKFAERSARPGINNSLITVLSQTGILLAKLVQVAPSYALAQIGGPGSFTADLAVIWSEMDKWSFATIAFVHEIPAAPGGQVPPPPPPLAVIPAGFFDAENAKLDEVKAMLAAKVGTTV